MVRLSAPEVDRLQARFSGTFDLDTELNRDEQFLVVAVVNVASLSLRSNRAGDTIGTYGMKVQDFALVRDPDVHKTIVANYPELEGRTADLPALEPESWDATWTETVVNPADYPDQVEVADTVEEEVFSPEHESRERGRLPGRTDAVLARFLAGYDDAEV